MVLGEIEECKPNKGKGKKKPKAASHNKEKEEEMHKGDMQEMVKNVMTRTRRREKCDDNE